ncbi:nucleotidyltransferase domain-containing protein [Candidatus Aerophobetes bacterium]|nr:nucleotidyltransferase domain-containing protein [Candidatus Aerophobetes bacterium]
MRTLRELNLKENEKKALHELKRRLLKKFPDAEIILYGSKARGDSDEESDIDVLVLLGREVNNTLEEEIFSISFKIELNYDVIFGIIVYPQKFWDSPLGKAMPLHWNVDKEGIPIA